MNKILKTKEVKFSELPDDFKIENLPDDVEIVFEENFPEMDESFWGDED